MTGPPQTDVTSNAHQSRHALHLLCGLLLRRVHYLRANRPPAAESGALVLQPGDRGRASDVSRLAEAEENFIFKFLRIIAP